MNQIRPPGDGKLFVVSRTALPDVPPREVRKRPLALSGDALIPLTMIFLAVVAFAGYACLYGSWPQAQGFLLVFLPPVCALLGAASTASFRR